MVAGPTQEQAHDRAHHAVLNGAVVTRFQAGVAVTRIGLMIVIAVLFTLLFLRLNSLNHRIKNLEGHVSPDGPAVACRIDGKIVPCKP